MLIQNVIFIMPFLFEFLAKIYPNPTQSGTTTTVIIGVVFFGSTSSASITFKCSNPNDIPSKDIRGQLLADNPPPQASGLSPTGTLQASNQPGGQNVWIPDPSGSYPG